MTGTADDQWEPARVELQLFDLLFPLLDATVKLPSASPFFLERPTLGFGDLLVALGAGHQRAQARVSQVRAVLEMRAEN